ncbi:zinc ribbon domain-containing protein [uncultured Methanobrevibacter sp.]|nr:zinc ribbon domain-containing protein [uncultured Methanobrevibacter sp.]
MEECPYCGELLETYELVCPHCYSDLELYWFGEY